VLRVKKPTMTAKDLMTRHVATLSPLTTVGEAARLLTEQRITGAPVVDAKGNLLGIVSQTDLVRHQGAGAEPWPGEPSKDPALTPVLSLMTGSVVTCEEDTPLDEVARVMLDRRIHRVLVTREGRVCGILTAMDLLRALPGASEKENRS
jgi:CBS domain-containing protein